MARHRKSVLGARRHAGAEVPQICWSAGGSFSPLSMVSYKSLGRPAMQFLCTLADAVASSAAAGLDVTTSSFVTVAPCELSVALVKGNEVVYREAPCRVMHWTNTWYCARPSNLAWITSHAVSWTLLKDHVSWLEATLVDSAYSLMHCPRAAGSPEI
jgi:hypothetical protein